MNKKQNDEHFFKLFSQAFHDVVVPELEEIKERLEKTATKEDIDTLDRKYNALRDGVDNHEKRIEKLEEQASIAS